MGAVAGASFLKQVLVLSMIAVVMTVGVYGLVAGIVRLDDFGLHLQQRQSSLAQRLGSGILSAASYLMKGLSVVGTAAMFMVGGAILTHGIPPLHQAIEHIAQLGSNLLLIGQALEVLVSPLLSTVFGVLVGALVVVVVALFGRLRSSVRMEG